jgi:hypothetical protein
MGAECVPSAEQMQEWAAEADGCLLALEPLLEGIFRRETDGGPDARNDDAPRSALAGIGSRATHGDARFRQKDE